MTELENGITKLGCVNHDCEKCKARAEQEPVAEVKLKERGGNAGLSTVIHEIYDPMREPLRVGDKLYTTPPQRTWVGLTDEEQNALWDRAEKRQAYQGVPALTALIQEVEAKLKEKNT